VSMDVLAPAYEHCGRVAQSYIRPAPRSVGLGTFAAGTAFNQLGI
jgi:hypothetical protein